MKTIQNSNWIPWSDVTNVKVIIPNYAIVILLIQIFDKSFNCQEQLSGTEQIV